MKEAGRQGLSLRYCHAVVANYLKEGQSTIHHRASLVERFHVMRKHYGLLPTVVMHLWFVIRSIIWDWKLRPTPSPSLGRLKIENWRLKVEDGRRLKISSRPARAACALPWAMHRLPLQGVLCLCISTKGVTMLFCAYSACRLLYSLNSYPEAWKPYLNQWLFHLEKAIGLNFTVLFLL